MKTLCIWLIRFYQRFLSPLKRQPTCRFYPTCSAYAIQAFTKRGFFVGMILTVWRILRCNPLCAPGYDPVPDHGFGTYGKGVDPVPGDSDDSEDSEDSDSYGNNDGQTEPKTICVDYMERRPTHKTCDPDRDGKPQGE